MSLSEMVVWGLRGALVLACLLVAWREVGLLFIKPARNMGPGWRRVWAVGRATMFEAWAGRVWLLPLLWLGAALLLIMAVRPFDESERIPLYIRTLLSSQEVLLLVMMWVMACVSLPRERERKVLVTNASKPLSRLEIILGKITGFGAVAGLLVLAMGIASLAVLHVSDLRLRSQAQENYDIQKRDFNKTLKTPSEGLKQLADQGSLFAYNYITVPKDGLNIGNLEISRDEGVPPRRWLIGGTREKAIYHFGPRLEIPDFATQMPAGARPYFAFFFPMMPLGAGPVAKVQIQVTLYAEGPITPQEKVLTLNSEGVAAWEPERPEDLFTTFNAKSAEVVQDRGMVTVEVTCPTPGVMLQVLDGADPDAKGSLPPGAQTNAEFANRLSDYFPGTPQTVNFPSEKPVVRGFERRDRQEVEGPKPGQLLPELAIYRFPGSSLRHVPLDEAGNFKLTVQLETYKLDNPQDPTYADIRVFSLDRTGATPFENKQLQVDEKRLMTITVPGANLGDKDPSRRGDLIVLLYCATPGHSISMVEDSVRIELAQTPFFVNFFKSEAVIFLEALLLITLSVTCSVRLGWAVAMFLSGIAFLFGHFVEFIAGLQDYGGLGALNYRAGVNPSALFNFFDTAASTLWKVLGFISILVPNFNRYQPQEFIGNLQNMPWSVLATDAFNTVIYVLPFLALAHLLFRKQELG